MPNLITATQAKNQFSDIVNRVIYNGEEFIVEKQGKPAVLITKPRKPVGKKAVKKFTTNDFLAKLANMHAKGLPPDLGKNHDKYAWD